jgi:hypothetical protein
MPRTTAMSNEMETCARLCHECHDECVRLVQHCLSLGGPHADVDHIRTVLDCADICRTSEDFLHRGSPLHHHICEACAEICTICGEDCDRFGDDAEMKRCAKVCHRCADECRAMAQAA